MKNEFAANRELARMGVIARDRGGRFQRKGSHGDKPGLHPWLECNEVRRR